MADRIDAGYNKSIGTGDRSAVAGTKLWGIILALVVLVGIILIATFYMSNGRGSSGPVSSENTASRPAEP